LCLWGGIDAAEGEKALRSATAGISAARGGCPKRSTGSFLDTCHTPRIASVLRISAANPFLCLGGFQVPAAATPYLTAGVALLSAGVICAGPVEVPAERIAGQSYQLTAASTALTAGAVAAGEPSLANVPANLLTMFLSIPAWQVQAMDRFADAMIATGSWQVWGPTNVFGFDEQDPPKLKAVIDMMMPFQPFSSVLGEQASWWAKANLPMDAGCAARPGACPDLNALLDAMFKVPMTRLNEGYRFPIVTNPFTGAPTSWSGQYVKLDPGAAFAALAAYLTGPPQTVASVSPDEASAAMAKASKAVADAFNPFVPNSEWFNPEQTGLAPVFRAAAPNFCRSCDTENLYDNPWLYDNYRPNSGPAPSAAVVETAGVRDAAPEVSDPEPETAAALDIVDAAEAPTEPRKTSFAADRPRRSGSAETTTRPAAAREARRSAP
jgi:hypothetical protein